MRIAIASVMLAAALAAGGAQAATKKAASHASSSMMMRSAATSLVDINSASADELDKLKGIGPARAAAIIKGRPYSGKDDLVTKKILTKRQYDAIKDQIVARRK